MLTNKTARSTVTVAALLGLGGITYLGLQSASRTDTDRGPLAPQTALASAHRSAGQAGAGTHGASNPEASTNSMLRRFVPAVFGGLAASENMVQLPNGDWARRLPDGRLLVVTEEPSEPVRPGVVTAYEMLTKHPDTARTLQAGISLSFGERQDCLSAFIHRGGRIVASSEWVMVLTVEAKGGIATIEHVDVPPEIWPFEFDDEVKNCYLKSFLGKTFPSDHDFRYVTEYPMCVNPPNGHSSAAHRDPHPERG